MLPTLDVIIVNWNAGGQLRSCLASLASSRREGFALARVVVVDNASADDSLVGLEAIELPLMLFRNDVNQGFARACNQGADGSRADYLLFLNPDTVLDPDSLDLPVMFMERAANAAVGVCGIQLVDESGNVTRNCARFPTLGTLLAVALGLPKLTRGRVRGLAMDDWSHDRTCEVDHVMGAFYLTRRGLYEAMQGFDERFFVYLEDLDLSLRVRRAGWKIVYLSETRAFHKGGGTSEQVKAARLHYVLSSRILYAFKNLGGLCGWMVMLTTVLLEPIFRIGYGLLRGELSAVAETINGYVRLWRTIPWKPIRRAS
jgi:hypothetical protein